MLTTLAWTLGGLGAALLARGIVGARTDRLPRCRACRYELTGLHDPTRCPECGNDLTPRRAVRLGHRRVRRWSIALGAPLALLAAWPVAEALTAGPLPGRPTWRLLLDLRLLEHGATRAAVRDELLARCWASRLKPWHHATLAAWSAQAWADNAQDAALRDPALFQQAVWSGTLVPAQFTAVIATAIEDLADDDVQGNADRAERVLDIIGPQAHAALRELVDTGDHQQRFAAARLCAQFADGDTDAGVLAVLLHNLRDDGVRENHRAAENALWECVWNAGPMQRELLEPALAAAAADDDLQLAATAATMLGTLQHPEPSGVLLDAVVDLLSLRRARPSDGYGHTPDVGVLVAILEAGLPAAAPRLEAMLAAGDPRQQFVAAYLLATHGLATDHDAAAAVLAEHLRDNTIRGDAPHACRAIYALGERALDTLADITEPDPQQAELLRLLVRDITDPPRTPGEWAQRWRGNPASLRLEWTPLPDDTRFLSIGWAW